MLFRDSDCEDDMGRFYAKENAYEKAEYTKDEMELNNFCNNCASSIMVPFGYTVDLYQSDAFSGDLKTIVGPVFNDDLLSLECINLDGFNNEVTSLAVYKNTVMGSSIGYWVSITATESVTFHTHYGLSYSTSETTTRSAEYTLTYEMGSSIKFAKALGFEDEVTKTY